MDINVIKMLKGKFDEGVFTLDQIKMICPDYEAQTEVLELLDNPFVQEFNRLQAEVAEHMEIPDVARYVELTRLVTKTGGHGGTKNPLPCQLCGNNSHGIKWTNALYDGVDNWVGTLTEECPKFQGTRFHIPKGSTNEEYVKAGLPISKGQTAGRTKSEPKTK